MNKKPTYTCEIQYMGMYDRGIVDGYQEIADEVLFDNDFNSVEDAQAAVEEACWNWLSEESGLSEYYTTETPAVFELTDHTKSRTQ